LTTLIPDITARRAALTPGATALRDLVSGRSLTYAQLEDRARRAAGVLLANGVSAGDRVAIMCRNRTEFFEILFACGKLGAILVPLNWRMPAPELQQLIDDAEPTVLFPGCEDAATAKALALKNTRMIPLDGDARDCYAEQRDRNEGLDGCRAWPAQDCWYLLYTSGTTGKPKAVIQTYGMAMANYVNISQAMSIGAGDVTLNYLPLFHTAGINLVTLPTLIQGGEVLVLPEFDQDRVVGLLEEGVLDTFFAVPAVYQQISLHPDFDALDLSRIRNWGCGGAPMPAGLLTRYIDRGARICNGMGMTETGPTAFIMDPETVLRKPGSVGKPQLLVSVRIVDSAGQDVVDGESGELWFAGPGITPGYWHRRDATAAAFSIDGWLQSGDIGRRDQDGYYYVVGRIKDMFISGGENVYPVEVENVLAGHPDILEAAVIAEPDEKWGEVGRAFLLARQHHQVPPDDELRKYCRRHLAPYKVPKSFVAVSDFPRTAAGKVRKHLLMEDK
jgi:fatty-acyl-CoA synthase